jgi:hypothetical protein
VNLSTHFTLEELIHCDLAVRRGLDNTPNADSIENLKVLTGYLEQIRELLKVPIIITSGYRALKVNVAVGGQQFSAHTRGEAADFIAPQFGTPKEIAMTIVNHDRIDYDQIIFEGAWVHFAINTRMRRQALTAHFQGGKATYTDGIA